MPKSPTFTRLHGKSKSGKPIVQKYSLYCQNRSYTALKYFFLILLILLLGYGLYYLHVNGLVVWFDRNLISEKTIIAIDLNILQIEFEHYFWSLLVGLIFGVYLSALLPVSGKRNKYITVVLIAIVFVFAILSLGYIGIFVWMNFPFLKYNTFISNQREGISFFIENLAFFLLLYAISFLIESEVD